MLFPLYLNLYYNNTYYCDGGLKNNFPIINCINYLKQKQSTTKKHSEENFYNSILAINHNKYTDKIIQLNKDDTIFQYMYYLIYKFIGETKVQYYSDIEKRREIPFIVDFSHNSTDVERFKNIIYKKEELYLLIKERNEVLNF